MMNAHNFPPLKKLHKDCRKTHPNRINLDVVLAVCTAIILIDVQESENNGTDFLVYDFFVEKAILN